MNENIFDKLDFGPFRSLLDDDEKRSNSITHKFGLQTYKYYSCNKKSSMIKLLT